MRGLMFNEEWGMWEAVLLRTKTNTRRCGEDMALLNESPDSWRMSSASADLFRFTDKKGNTIDITPRHKVNSICYLQEPTLNTKGYVSDDKQVFYKYKDHNGNADIDTFGPLITQALQKGAKWQNKMFMNPNDARYYIKITGINAQRLHDISEEDCLAEGLHNKHSMGPKRLFLAYEKNIPYKKGAIFTQHPKLSYESLFKIVSDANAWDNNHWCISYYFKLLTAKEVEQHKFDVYDSRTGKTIAQ